jgi:hypothetical protein
LFADLLANLLPRDYIISGKGLRPHLARRFVWRLRTRLKGLVKRDHEFAYKCKRPREAKKRGHQKRKKRVGRFSAFFILKSAKLYYSAFPPQSNCPVKINAREAGRGSKYPGLKCLLENVVFFCSL